MMKSTDKAYDFKLQVRHQPREEPASVARLYTDIFTVTLNDFVDVMFIPSFPRRRENWSLNIADDVEDVRSRDEARQFMAALSEYTVTPNDQRAGQQELIPLARHLPPLPRNPDDPTTGIIFYVTQKEFIRFSQELAVMEEHTLSVYDCLPFSEVKEFESIQFILNQIAAHFSERDFEIVNLPWHHHLLREVSFNKIEPLLPDDEDKQKEVAQQKAALQLV